ncbi:FAD-dependent monooxygenase [Nocardiopsis sp. RSe5-2]|uniref:FAD-dependent monooxygenase n=1 Tax=Nocardiopsis endophytica TaxID=3018445 RepID=A0ABT4U7M7_9ACTN|nr:FAD-dependent monooxygenase [Nocardiopsis endophytica]MDA2812963.1 FAD-dependent monooxygenase [Nocardiopsis endophytica]
MTRTEHSPVLIVGAGLAGASAAVFLALHGVRALAVSRHPGPSDQPKARGQSWPTMEALRIAGVAETVRAAGFDVDRPMPIVIARSLTEPPLHEIIGEDWPDWSHLTPERMGMASQERTEPVLIGRARELGAEVRFSTRIESFDQDGEGVTAHLRDLDTGEGYAVRARYLVAADGWRGGIRDALGIGTHGRGTISTSVGLVAEADLAEATQGREFSLYYLQNPRMAGGGGAFTTTDTPGRYALAFGHDPASGKEAEDYTDAECAEQVRIAAGIPDLDVKIVAKDLTGTAHVVADRFSEGRVHLIGDCAHTMPPHGGQGGNTAVMDGFHLAWKLAAVVQGWAGEGLLASHDAERRPHGQMVADQQYANMVRRQTPHLADGTEAEEVSPERLLLGHRVPEGAVVREAGDDGAPTEDPAEPTGRPGSHAPHVWLERDGEPLPVLDLFGRGFVLLAEDPAWAEAAERAAEVLGVPLRAEVVGVPGSGRGLVDPQGRWRTLYGIPSHGATLVRPDRFIAWRTASPADADELERALRTVLCRTDG